MSTDYLDELDPPTQKRFKEKLEVIENTDHIQHQILIFLLKFAIFHQDFIQTYSQLSCVYPEPIFC